MDKRTFYSTQNVQPDELNGLVNVVDQAIGQAGYETGARGVIYGLGVESVSPATLAVKAHPGMAAFYDPAAVNTGTNSNRKGAACRLAADASITITSDYLGAGTSVGSGQERWVTLVIRPSAVLSDPRTDGTGAVVDFISTESGVLAVVAGTSAAAGSAVRPDVSAIGIRLSDYLLTYGMTTAPAPDLSAREDMVETLMGGDAGYGNAKGYSLFWQSSRNSFGVGVLRAYLCSGGTGYGPAGIVLTLNAHWDEGAKLWYGTDGVPCMSMRLGAQGMLFTTRTQSLTAGWAENTVDGSWGNMINPGDTDSVLMGPGGLKVFGKAKSALLKSDGVITARDGAHGVDDSSVTVVAVVSGPAGTISVGGVVSPLEVFVPFPRPFAWTPSHILVHTDVDIYTSNGVGIGSSYDRNVTAYVAVPTPYGLLISIQPSAVGAYTAWKRVITVSS